MWAKKNGHHHYFFFSVCPFSFSLLQKARLVFLCAQRESAAECRCPTRTVVIGLNMRRRRRRRERTRNNIRTKKPLLLFPFLFRSFSFGRHRFCDIYFVYTYLGLLLLSHRWRVRTFAHEWRKKEREREWTNARLSATTITSATDCTKKRRREKSSASIVSRAGEKEERTGKNGVVVAVAFIVDRWSSRPGEKYN